VAVLRSVQGGAPDRVDGFELAYVTRDGEQGRVALAEAWSLQLERAEPVRRFASYSGQRHLPGLWWSATDALRPPATPAGAGGEGELIPQWPSQQ
jgi:hypothetical protein